MDTSRAALAARGWYELRFRNVQEPNAVLLDTESLIAAGAAKPIVVEGRIIAYAFDTPGGGCIVIAGDDELPPVLYYSLSDCITVPVLPPARIIMEGFADGVAYLQDHPRRRTRVTHPFWAVLEEWADQPRTVKTQAALALSRVGPLVTSSWSQGGPYNDQCPIYQGERSGAGCVAIAMAQVMRYWQHPTKGTGSHSYYWSLGEKVLSAYFGSTTYDWANMPDRANHTSPQAVKDAVSIVCYHCGVSVETQYSPEGSAATFDGRALTMYFGYKYTRVLKRSDYANADWHDLIRAQIDNGQPILYKLKGADAFHLAVLDGYENPDLVHLNMGLGGFQDGWYSIDTSPGISRTENSAIVDIRPHAGTIYYVNGSIGNDAWDGTASGWAGGSRGPKKTIQAGIYATGPHDTVIVADGTYTGVGNRDLDVGDRLITVRSASGATRCIIDCEGAGRGFYLGSAVTDLTTLDGFTIRNGSADYGGGIFCWYGSPTIINCVITSNAAGQAGGGLYGCNGTIQNCTIIGNSSDFGGGLAFCDGTIRNCAITQNTAAQVGGGLYDCSGTIQNNTITANSARWGGGLASCNGTIQNCLISANACSDQVGGGLSKCDGTIQNCTITANSARVGGGLGWCKGIIANCIIWGNRANFEGQLYESAIPMFSCVEGMKVTGGKNLSADPRFVDPNGPDDRSDTYEDNDYRLKSTSPCIDKGKNEDWMAHAVDLDGNNRIFYGGKSATVDMGAYEYGSFRFRIEAIVKMAGGEAELTWRSRPGHTYTIWSCLDLLAGQWVEETTLLSGGETTNWKDARITSSQKFYRIELK